MQLVRTSMIVASLVLAAAVARAEPPAEPKIGQAGKDVIWIPTPEPVVERMLRTAQVTEKDHVVDLGAGDGRLVIVAAREFGARATGIEYDAGLVAVARREAARLKLPAGRFAMVQGDVFKVDFRDATVVGLYLLPEMLLRLRPILLRMRPGTRIVSHHFKIPDWEPDEVSWVGVRGVYLWIVPADVAGGWRLTTSDGLAVDVDVEQSFQRFKGRAQLASVKAGLRGTSLVGDAIAFAFVDEQGVLREFSGRVLADRVEGTFRAGASTGTWTAARR
jgi:SAM-dependent methyltransferase